MSAGSVAAGAGGLAALAGSALLPFHAGGRLGSWIAGLFLVAGLLLAAASMAFATRFPHRGSGGLRSWALLGAAGLAVSGYGLVGDLIESPLVGGEIAAVAAFGFWWGAVGVLARSRWPKFAAFSLLCAAGALAAVLVHFLWTDPPAGAVPVRFAYVLWAPWGLALAAALARRGGPTA